MQPRSICVKPSLRCCHRPSAETVAHHHLLSRGTPARVRKFYADAAIPAESFASAVAFAMSQPEDVDINEIVFRPMRQEL